TTHLRAGATVFHIEYSIHSYKITGFYRTGYKNAAGEKSYMVVTQFEATDCRKALPSSDKRNLNATFDVVPGGHRPIDRKALQALGTSIAESSLHQPMRLSVPSFVADNHVDLIDSEISRPRLLREYIVDHKAKSKHLATSGQRSRRPRTNGKIIGRSLQFNLRGKSTKSSPLGGRKISTGASTTVKSLAAAASQPKTQPSQPLVVSRTCVDCNIAISPAWWNKAELLTQLGLLSVEEVVPVHILSPPVVALKPPSPATQVEELESVWLCHGCLWTLKDRAAAVAGKG
ncbi:hypothetical protein HKX48_001645, partial [Thoreauomyces humboldtii]